MRAGAIFRNIDDYYLSLKTFNIALAAFLTLGVASVIVAGFRGEAPVQGAEQVISLASERMVAVNAGDLNQLDIRTPPPATTPSATEAGKPQPRNNVDEAVVGLFEQTPYGPAPVIRKTDNLTAFKAYAPAFTPAPDTKALISFVMVDFGLSDKLSTSSITDLPEGVTFAIDPYVKNAQKYANSARKYNHEIWISLPLQTKNYPAVDSGPKTLLANMDPAESNKRLLQTLGIATGYVGVVIAGGDGFKDNKDNLNKIIASVAARGLGIAKSDPTDTMTSDIAAANKAPFAQNNTWIAQISSEKELKAKFIDIESAAVKNKQLVVFFRPYPATIKAIEAFAKDSSSRGIQLAPLSAVTTK